MHDRSTMTIRTYQVSPDGQPSEASDERTIPGVPITDLLGFNTRTWPECECPQHAS